MKIKKYQEGGAMPQPAPETQDPILQIADIFAQGLQSGDCQLLSQGAEMFLQLMSQASAPAGPVDQVPEGAPVFKRGGQIVGRKK